jgi:phosphotransferase system HPr-like phosphotransfer protein
MNAQIKLNSPNEVRDFVDEASKCDFDIDIFYNHLVVDAKSLLGVLSMDLTKVLSVACQGHDNHFESVLEKYTIA